MTDFRQGDSVHVDGFGKGVVREVRNRGRYLVEVKGRAMEVAAAQMAAIEGKPQRHRPTGSASGEPSEARGTTVTVDLHGHTVDEALEALDTCLSDALLAGASEVRAIHGKSGGRVKTAVHQHLRSQSSIRAFRLDPHNPGVTIIVL